MIRCCCVLGIVSMIVAVAGIDAAAHHRTEVPVRGHFEEEDSTIQLNCPSIVGTFPPGSVRCEACLAVTSRIFHHVALANLDPLDAVDAQTCEFLYANAELRQRKNGRRYFSIKGIQNNAAAGIVDDGDDDDCQHKQSEDSPLTFHSAAEQNVLPCATYLLKRYCFAMIELHEDELTSCVEAFQTAEKRNKMNFDKEQRTAVTRQARQVFKQCLRDVCEGSSSSSPSVRGDCAHRELATLQAKERELFMMYEGAFGNEKLKYVEDEDTPGLLVQNPYARGGAREGDNPYLRPESEL